VLKGCIFFDRDGIVNRVPPPEEYYVLKVEQLHIVPAFLEALRVVRSRGFEAVIVTNQKCVHRGLLTLHELDRIHAQVRQVVREAFSI